MPQNPAPDVGTLARQPDASSVTIGPLEVTTAYRDPRDGAPTLGLIPWRGANPFALTLDETRLLLAAVRAARVVLDANGGPA
jgi:hypothetical protein